MFADDIISAAADGPDRSWGWQTPSGGVLSRMASWLMRQEVQRFIISTEVVKSGHAVLARPVPEQLRAMTLCRAPFFRNWFEWREGDYGARRVGIFLECDGADTRKGHCSFVFSGFSKDKIAVLPIAGIFDWRELPDAVPDRASWQIHDEEHFRQQCEMGHWKDTPYETARALTLRQGLVRLADTPDADEVPTEHKNHIARMARAYLDLTRSLILLLNSRNLTRAEPQTISEKLQHARDAAKKPPLLDYTLITIRLSHALRMRAAEASDPRNPMRFHVVRGHFKIRKTGVFWWSSFPRGSLEAGQVKQLVRKVVP
jgi:hypothetical protein